MLNRNDIKTVVAEVININTGETTEPVFEAYGYEKFLGFVKFYADLALTDNIVRVRGYGYNDENGAQVMLAQEFIGVCGQTTARNLDLVATN